MPSSLRMTVVQNRVALVVVECDEQCLGADVWVLAAKCAPLAGWPQLLVAACVHGPLIPKPKKPYMRRA